MLELRHLYLMSALRTYQSLANAAEEMHVTPSAVSHQLKELEHFYGITLVNRRSRPLSFTPAGKELLRLADTVLPMVERANANLKRLAHGQIGRLRLASECHSCFDWLMPILNRYRRDWSDVELDFASGFEPQPHQMLLDDDIDVLITASPLPLAGIDYLPLFEYESRLLLAPNHPLARQTTPITPQDIAPYTLIAYPVDSTRLDIMTQFLLPANVEPSKIRTTELTAMLVQLVASERGVAALPDWVAAEYENKGWVVSRALGEGVYCQLYAAIRQTSQQIVYMQGFLQLLQDMVKPARQALLNG